ncbi:NAD(P)H-hydrate dehydratase [Tissierella sp.]|uniref:NAD(P)H-hydrate dehydratase n=1 Tax=Tissierella sp. TaxID=41274 RepID=UPI0028A97AB8|nr:NAD(P)H-hydrate dehydratase [Tissierella sp.]
MFYENMIDIGTDIVNVNRIKNIILEKKDRFYHKIFTPKEIEYIVKGNDKATTVAGIFAAKEAISKVLGTGIGMVRWKEIEILHYDNGKPYVNLIGSGSLKLQELGFDGMKVSISHEENYAIAFAMGYRSNDINIKIDNSIKKLLPKREKDSHKGTYGRVAIIGGSRGMVGAPYLTSMAALRTGSGLVYTIIPKSLETIMSIKLTEAIVKSAEDNKGYFTKDSLIDILKGIENMNVLAIGPGIGADEERAYLIEGIIKNCNIPIVLDADGINCLSFNPSILYNRNQSIVITPHPGELARFLGKNIKEIQENRIYYSKYTSHKYNIIVVLKGCNTIVAEPSGELYINATGNPGMATAGSGDLLTGIIASFIGQGIRPFDAAKLGVFCHGLAGDLATAYKGEYGIISTDILECIPDSIKKIYK